MTQKQKNASPVKKNQSVKTLIKKHRKIAKAQQEGNCGPIGGWGN